VLDARLRQFIKSGSLEVIWPNGRRARYGRDGAVPQASVRLVGRLTPLKLALYPDLFLGEAYMDGMLRLEHGSLWDLLDLLARNVPVETDPGLLRAVRPTLNRMVQQNSRRLSRRNAAHHYDLSSELYRLFLDHDLQYSCAYFARPDLDLEAAQRTKKSHLAAKLQLRPGHRVLDIGCGWGGLALSLASAEDVEVVGITLSRVFQMQLSAEVDVVPLTRDYLFEAERGVRPFHGFSVTDDQPPDFPAWGRRGAKAKAANDHLDED
jgi:cyclopropane-fatty-acyl-phospholipid synthase